MSTHRVNIVRIYEILPHTNADSLGLVMVGGYQVVVRLADWKVGDLGVYVPPDSVVPVHSAFAFLWADKEFPDGEVPVKYRRVTVRRFRKEYSEGLLLPVSDFPNEIPNSPIVEAGDDVSEVLGITHYEPPEIPENTKGENERGPQYHRFPRSAKGWMYYILDLVLRTFGIHRKTYGTNEPISSNAPPVYDIEAYKNHVHAFEVGEQVVVTEKLHGSNARYVFRDGKMYAGSRNLWKSAKSGCIWRKALVDNPWIEEFCRANEGCVLYGEVVPTQKLKGGQVCRYGVPEGKAGFFVFDVLIPEGKWLELYNPNENAAIAGIFLGDRLVPLLYVGNFDPEKIKSFVSGASTLDPTQTREGIVIRPVSERHVRGLGRLQLKIHSNEFLEQS